MNINSSESKICLHCKIRKLTSEFTVHKSNGRRSGKCKSCIIKLNGGVDRKHCRACDVTKPLEDFPTCGNTGKKGPRCTECKNNKILIPKELKYITSQRRKDSYQRIVHITKKDYKQTYEFLNEKLGYDLNSKKTIHEQFCERYNLIPNFPLNQFKDFHSIEDCFE
jgi:hypothetical protein